MRFRLIFPAQALLPRPSQCRALHSFAGRNVAQGRLTTPLTLWKYRGFTLLRGGPGFSRKPATLCQTEDDCSYQTNINCVEALRLKDEKFGRRLGSVCVGLVLFDSCWFCSVRSIWLGAVLYGSVRFNSSMPGAGRGDVFSLPIISLNPPLHTHGCNKRHLFW